jgi:pyruvate ferredoxin oxidoreductase delta subunit
MLEHKRVPEYEQLNWVVVHGRGVLNTAHGSTFARILATAGLLSGRESYYYMRYDDSPERDNIPMMFYTVIGNPTIDVTLHEEVEPFGEIFDAIVVMEPTLLITETSQRALLFDGAKKNAILVVNTSLSSDRVAELVKKYSLAQNWFGKLVTVRAKSYESNIAYPLLGALLRAWNVVSLDTLSMALDSLGTGKKAEVVRRAYEEARPVDVKISAEETDAAKRRRETRPPPEFRREPWDLKTYREYQTAVAKAPSYAERMNVVPRWESLAPGLIEFGPPPREANIGFKTSFARYLRPVIDVNICTDCKLCALYCPEGCIDFNTIKVDYDYCKGCEVCKQVCAPDAITMIGELEAKEGLKETEITTIAQALREYGY